MSTRSDTKSSSDRALGMDQKITRQDFLNSALLASGALLAGKSPLDLISEDDWTGYGGVGDYSNSNGNTYEVMTDGHRIRDRVFAGSRKNIHDTREEFDCVIVGGGISGLAAALFLQRDSRSGKRTCLILDNHPIFGGEAKRNEFNVDGQRLIAHQASAMCFPPLPNTFLGEFYPSIGIDWQEFKYQTWQGSERELPLGNTPYMEYAKQSGFYFGAKFGHQEGLWLIDPWGKYLEDAHVSAALRAECQRTHDGSNSAIFTPPKQHGDEISPNLDRITLEQHICERYQVSPETVRTFISPLAGGGSGLGADVLSGYADYAADVVFPWQYDQGPQM